MCGDLRTLLYMNTYDGWGVFTFVLEIKVCVMSPFVVVGCVLNCDVWMLIMQVGKQVHIDRKMGMCGRSYEQIDVGRDRQQTDRQIADRQTDSRQTTYIRKDNKTDR